MKTFEAILFSALFLTLVCIQSPVKSLSTITNDEANEFKIGETVEFNPLNKNCFKYYNTKDIAIIFSFINLKFEFYYLEIQDPDGNEIEIREFDEHYEFTLNKTGYHSFTIKSSYPYFGIVEKFTTFAPGEVIDTIDLNKEMYYNKLSLYLSKKYDPMKYIIEELDSDKYVYFYTYAYNNNIFKVCINENETCESNVKFFHFQKNNKYTIYIQLQDNYGEYIRYYPYIIAPVTKTTIETKNLGIFMNASPKIYNIEIENKEKYIYFAYYEQILIAYSNDKIENSNIQKITNLEFEEYYSSDNANKLNNTFSYAIIIVIPDIFEAEGVATRIALAENVIDSLKSEQLKNEEIIIDSDKSTILYLNSDYFYNNNNLEFYNILLTFSSSSKNMRYIHSSNLENKFDFLMNDYLHLPMYIDKDSKEQKIQFKVYYPRYTFFGAGDSEMFKLFYEYLKTPLYTDIDYNWESLLPLNIRVNSDLSPFYEFFNFYFNKFEDNINLYINKLYGETDLYECSDELDQNDLSILTTPINKCKDKKSIFNRLFTFKGTKILSGYLTPNSYFDVYLEMNDNSKKIKISPAFEGGVNSASKYIKKDIEYTVDFTVEHMVKIEVVENVEVTIYNDESNIKLNSKKPVQEIKGSNYKVKTNRDTMIYFYGKIFKYIGQKEIDPEQKGKYATIFSNTRLHYTIDSGFLGYNPLNIDLSMSYIDYNIYIENLYEKMKNKLVENEKIFLYYLNEDDFDKNEEYDDYEEPKIDIEYQDSLNNPNNDYSFTVIPSNSREKSLIINNRNKGEIIYGVNFCGEPHEVNMTVKSIYDGEYIINFKKEEPLTVVNIDEYQTKLNFQSDKEFIFSYSFLDMADNNFIDSDDWLDERKEEESSNLKIIEVKDTSSDDNILSITFVPSIKNSNVKYIIVIAPKNGDNKKENFSNPCFIAKLVNDKKEGIKIQNWIDPGITSTITAEVDISDILNSKNNNYVVGIISQELRFNKQLNFYSAFEFTYEGKSKNDENDENDDDSKGNKTLVIVFSVVGAVIVIALILLIVCMIKKKRGSSSFDTDNNNENKLLSDM